MSSKTHVLFCIHHVDFILKLVPLTGVVGQLVFSFLTRERKRLGFFFSFLPCLLSPWLISELATSKVYEIFISQSPHFLKLEDRGSAFPEAHGCTGEELIPEQNQGLVLFCFVFVFVFVFVLRKRNEPIYWIDLISSLCLAGERGEKNFF